VTSDREIMDALTNSLESGYEEWESRRFQGAIEFLISMDDDSDFFRNLVSNLRETGSTERNFTDPYRRLAGVSFDVLGQEVRVVSHIGSMGNFCHRYRGRDRVPVKELFDAANEVVAGRASIMALFDAERRLYPS